MYPNPYCNRVVLVPMQAASIKRQPLCKGPVFYLSTTGLVTSVEGSADLGLNPCQWAELPPVGTIELTINHPVAGSDAALPVNVVIPSGQSTVTNGGSQKVPVTDHNGNQVTGADIPSITRVMVYYNKRSGVFQFMNFKAATTPAPANAGETPAPANVVVKSAKAQS